MATYDFAYYGYPLDEATLNKMDKELANAVWHELHHNYESEWLSSNYHGGASTPMWIGVQVDILKSAQPHKHIKFCEYVQVPSLDYTNEYIEKFANTWAKTPKEIKDALTAIHGGPELWIGEATT